MDNASAYRILVVDDFADMRTTLRDVLQALGFRVLLADSAETAREIVARHAINLVISDVHMPGESGVGLLSYIRRAHPNLPVIIMSAAQSVELAVECLKIGANDFLPKPFDIRKVQQTVTDILANWESQSCDRTEKTVCQDRDGRILGGFKVLHMIGRGAMGYVFLAEGEMDGTSHRYALKILQPGRNLGQSTKSSLQRFLHECEAASRVNHPNVVKIIEYGLAQEEMVPFLVMEYVEGQGLNEVIAKSAAYSHGAKIGILVQIAEGLAAIHENQICHRDIKPQNILLDHENVVKITDFGVAQLPESELTVATAILGTPNYLSPEAFKSSRIDHRADLFSLGVIAYELLVGHRPFVGSNIPVLAYKVRETVPVAPVRRLENFPLTLQAILGKMLKKRVECRYQSAHAVADDLHRYLDAGDPDSNPFALYEDEDDWREPTDIVGFRH